MKKAKVFEWVAEEVECPFKDDKFWELWVKLLKSPKWSKKPLSAVQMACQRLKRFDVDFAANLVETAIEGNYQGVVFPDTAQRYELYKKRLNGSATHQQLPNDWAKLGTSDARIKKASQW